MNKQLLATLYENKVFLMLLEELGKARPILPAYDWKDPLSIERMKAMSCQQQGFDKALAIITFNGEIK